MALDANVFAQFGTRPKGLNEYRAELDAQAANSQLEQMNALKLQQTRQAIADDAAYRDAAKGFGTDQAANYNALIQRGLVGQAQAYQKSALDAKKTQADIDQSNASATKSRADAEKTGIESFQARLGTGMKVLQAGTSPQALIQGLTQSVQQGLMTREEALQSISDMPQDPSQFAKWRDDQLLQGMDLGKRLEDQRARAQQAETARHNKATEGLTAAGQRQQLQIANMVDERAREAAAQGKVPAGYRQNPDGTLSFIPGGPADPAAAKRAAPTEDERKAAGWLAQARNGFKNMEQAIADDPSASKPGVIESLPFVVEGIKNTTRSEARQRFNQGASSFAEAALRAATGAGVNKDEAQQKIAELTPQWGDKPEVIQQKREGLDVYLQSLEARAGRAGTPDPSLTPKPVDGAFADADKERRYQEWKAKQGGKK